jgi:hypothetical protein
MEFCGKAKQLILLVRRNLKPFKLKKDHVPKNVSNAIDTYKRKIKLNTIYKIVVIQK